MGIIDELKNYRVGTDLASWHPTICDRAADYIIVLLSRVEAAEARAEKAEKCISEIEEAIKFQRYSAAMLWISEYRGQKEE